LGLILEEAAIRLDGHRLEGPTTIGQLHLRLGEPWLRIGCLSHGYGRGHNNLRALGALGAVAATTSHNLLIFLYVHHTPYDEDEDDHVHKETEGGGTSCRGRDGRTQNSPDETEGLGVRDDEKGETRNDGGDELLLLFFTITPTTTIFKKTHDLF